MKNLYVKTFPPHGPRRVEYWQTQKSKFKALNFWTDGHLNLFNMPQVAQTIDSWCEENCRGYFAILSNHQYFEYEDDKAAFILRWL